MSYRFRLGVKLLRWGAVLLFNTKSSKILFKDAINRNTLTGSCVESGNHIAGYVQPMCEYDTQSVINVLKQELLVENDVAFVGLTTTVYEDYYKEQWKY